ncbi:MULTISPECIES: hypothetical protein [unclassified Streptomyces]|uniref:hypothetical protein n=1 Tax=unclassified Streptomyces TaxID=2593676 RepID=UPI000AD7D983|nr:MULTISPECIES: hypothetical protein [unclassified Streptomyces]MCP3766797.1 hypothetical protein [Streptomyces sp. MAR25Y5]
MRKHSVQAGRRAVPLVLTALTGLALVTGCGLPDHRAPAARTDGPTTSEPAVAPKAPVPSGEPLGPDAHVPDPGVIDDNDATSVSKAWAETTYGYDTAYDTSPHDAVLRGVRWCTERKAAAERRFRPAGGPGDQWNTWERHRAWTTPSVSSELEDDAPRDSETIAYRSLVVNGTAQGRDGWTGTGPRLNAYVKLVRTAVGKPWRVDDVTVVEAVTPPGQDGASASPGSSSDDFTQ